MGGLGFPELIVILVMIVVIWLPWSRIFSKAGYSPWLSLTIFVPLVNLIVLFWFAFSEWPILRRGTGESAPSLIDGRPEKGIVYTESELEAMKAAERGPGKAG